MRITKGKCVDRQAIGRAQAKMDAAKRVAYKEMKDLAAQRQAVGAKKGEGRVGGVHRDAMFAAIASEGPEVLTAAAKSWWDDQKRRNPWMCADGVVPGTDSINGHVCKYGKVSERWMNGKWYHWENGKGWVEGELKKGKLK